MVAPDHPAGDEANAPSYISRKGAPQPAVAPDPSAEEPDALDHSEGEGCRGSSRGSAFIGSSGPQQPMVAPDPSADCEATPQNKHKQGKCPTNYFLEDLVRKSEALRARLNQARTKEDMISLTNQYADVVQLISDTADRLGIAVPEAPHSAAHRV